ncbi:cyclin-domain-containing protein [Pisolithus orientalis]|uniref:cyclin-domain-containing protein n=1 Tax=Pisolithus orientalis TaxID=936130 RepID=UPI0022244AD6|nr:cyclin-domain-containing protein [Pisolithus orientalis]KAI6035604.1 cyclin-domain-containing protein [Pisolithus orientalis]
MLALVHPLPRKPPIQQHRHHYQESSSAQKTASGSSTVACNSHPARPNAVQPPYSTNQQPTYAATKKAPCDKQPQAPPPTTQPVDIHSYVQTDLLKLLASLLTQIASTNDALASTDPADTLSTFSHPTPPEDSTRASIWRSLTSASHAALANPASALTFHARNIPTITLEAYLLRILRYCPTTNEVFLALLVYFDRMSRLAQETTGRTFVIDSYNVHRLVIAGVTVASKFFSDVFYTNSRYAKVGGLPQAELNQLELQFLLLNDFRLVISPEEMQKYAEQLILFSHSQQQQPPPPVPSSSSSSSATPHPRISPRLHSSTYSSSGPARAMGAIDAYGGTVAPDRTPSMRPAHAPSVHGYAPSSSHHHYPTNSSRDDDASSIVSTDTETTETEGGDTTDDEPTIRPPNSASSCCGDALEDQEGVREGECNGSRGEGKDGSVERLADKGIGRRADVEGDGDRGDATPELRAQRRVREISEDIGMGSP